MASIATRKSPPGRDRLLAAAERLFAQQGFDMVSTKALALAAGVTIGALYHHFPSKDDVYRATLDAAFAKLPDAPEALLGDDGDDRDRLFRLVAWYSATIAAPSDAAMLLRRELLDPHLGISLSDVAVFKRPLTQFRILLARIAPQADAETAIASIVSLAFGFAALKGLRPVAPSLASMMDDSDAIARSVTGLVLRGI